MFSNLVFVEKDDLYIVVPFLPRLIPNAKSYVLECLKTVVPEERILEEVPKDMTRHPHPHLVGKYHSERKVTGSVNPRENEMGCNFIRETLLKIADKPRLIEEVPYLYISRRDNSSSEYHKGRNARDVVNQEELLSRLPQFKSFCFGDLPFVQQIQLVRDAKIILAPHGAALIHILAGNKDLKIVELVAEINTCSVFLEKSRILGIDHHQMSFPSDRDENMTVDIDQVVNKVKELMPVE
jgi:capsular polysaccharide biosynthesis protein